MSQLEDLVLLICGSNSQSTFYSFLGLTLCDLEISGNIVLCKKDGVLTNRISVMHNFMWLSILNRHSNA